MKIIKSLILSVLSLSSLGAAIPPLTQISPTTPDIILDLPTFANLESLMTNDFNSPFYPFWDDLSGVIGQFNTYIPGSGGITINPTNDKFMALVVSQDRFRDLRGVYTRFNGLNLPSLSSDGGKTWDFQIITPPIGLGGTLSQQPINAMNLAFSKCGVLYQSFYFTDMHTNPPRTAPLSGAVFLRSFDNGQTWSNPIILSTAVSGAFANGALSGLALRTSGLLADPAQSNLVHISGSHVLYPTTFYGTILYFRSEDEGETWSPTKEVYNLLDDPVWVAQNFNPNFPGGGQAQARGNPVRVDENVLLIPMLRWYPKKDSLVYNQQPANTVQDRAVVRSLDNGKTWSPIAGAIEPFIFAFSHDPSGGIVNSLIFNDGLLNNPIVISPYTGRIYNAFQAGNKNINSIDPNVIQGFPYIALSASSDKGATWSPLVQINRTPTNLSFNAQQAFDPNLIFTDDGSLVVVYYDFRNYAGGPFLSCNAWMDIYKETSDPKGGSTGVGLDFVKEIRLTPTFDAAIGLRSTLQGIGPVIALGKNKRNEVFYNLTITNQGNLPTFPGFKGMTIDVNNRTNVFLGKIKFPNRSSR